MQKTKIEYLTHTWNPIAMRCTPVSAGCANCWHLAMAKRLGAPRSVGEYNPDKFLVRQAYLGGPPVLIGKELEAPLRKPARIGVQFMGDLFHENIPRGFVDAVWSTMAEAKHHTFLVLTKRPTQLLYFMGDRKNKGWKADWQNIWLGVSVEDNKTLPRIDTLKASGGAKLFVSLEPLLERLPTLGEHLDGIDWVVLGGETGSHARPLHPDWVRSVRDQCQAAGVEFFFKSWGEWSPQERRNWYKKVDHKYFGYEDDGPFQNGPWMFRAGHKHSGHLLDGKEWKEMP